MLNYLITLLFEDNEKLCTCKLQFGFKRHSLQSIHDVFTAAQCNIHVHRGISTVYILMYCVLRSACNTSGLRDQPHKPQGSAVKYFVKYVIMTSKSSVRFKCKQIQQHYKQ